MADNIPLDNIPQMSLQALATLLAVHRHGSAQSAARNTGTQVSAITRQIQDLERKIGDVPLFVRHSRGMRLTDAGHAYAEMAQRVIDEVKRTQDRLELKPAARTERLRGFVSEILLDHYVFPTVAHFTKRFPHVAVDIAIGPAEMAEAEMEAGLASFATVFGMMPGKHVEVVDAVKCPLVAVVGYDHDLAGRQKMSVEEILRSNWPLGLLPEKFSTHKLFREMQMRAVPHAHLPNFVGITVNSHQHLSQYCIMHRAIAILPELAVREAVRRKRLWKIEIIDGGLEQASFSLCRGTRPQSEIAQLFFEELRKAFALLRSDEKPSPSEPPTEDLGHTV